MIELELKDRVAHIVLNKPKSLNAMGPWFWDNMAEVVEKIDANEDIRVAVLSAKGRAFTAGLDFMGMMPRFPMGGKGPDASRQHKLHAMIRQMQWSVTSLERCRVPVIAAIHGYCIGAGVDLITACDIRLATDDALFSVREVKVGIVADIGTLQRLPRVVTPGIARELVFTGCDVDAQRAQDIGLVNQVFESQEAMVERALTMANEIASNAPRAVQGSKFVMNQAVAGDTDRGLEYVATWNAAHLVSQDLATAVTAFAQKKVPEFTGR